MRISPLAVPISRASGASCTAGSTRISSTNRLKPAMPLRNCSTKAASFRTGVRKVEIYRMNALRSMKVISPRRMKKPPAATVSTFMAGRANSSPAW